MIPEHPYRLLRLKTGENLIAECIEKDDQHIILHRPMEIQVLMGYDDSNNVFPAKLVMSDWLQFSKGNNVVLPIDHILAFSEPNEMIVAVYEREKLRIDAEKYNKKPADESNPGVDDGPEQKKEEPKSDPKKKNPKELILIQLTRKTLLRLLKQLGMEVHGMDNFAFEQDDDDDDSDFDESDEPEFDNRDGSGDIMPDPDGDGFHTPWGDRYDGPPPNK